MLRRQLEGAVERLEAARDTYRRLESLLRQEHWASALMLDAEPVVSAGQMEAAVSDATAAVARRLSRGDVGGDDVPVAGEVAELRQRLAQLARARSEVAEDVGLPQLLREVQEKAGNAVTLLRRPWWAPGKATLEATMGAPPERFLEELRASRSSEAAPIVDVDGDHFEVVWRDEKGRPVSRMKGSVRAVGHGSMVTAKVSLSASYLFGQMVGSIFTTLSAICGVCAALSLGLTVRIARRDSAKAAEHLVSFARQVVAPCQWPLPLPAGQ